MSTTPDTGMTREQAMQNALDWAEGRLSHMNEMMAAETYIDGQPDRQKTLVATAQADAAEVAKWMAVATGLSQTERRCSKCGGSRGSLVPDPVRGGYSHEFGDDCRGGDRV